MMLPRERIKAKEKLILKHFQIWFQFILHFVITFGDIFQRSLSRFSVQQMNHEFI
jgi:hypothetical protein